MASNDDEDDLSPFDWSFPFRFEANHRIAISRPTEVHRESIEQIIFTALGERVMRPEIGSTIRRFLFETLDNGTAELLADQLRDEIERNDPLLSITSLVPTISRKERTIILDIEFEAPGRRSGSMQVALPLGGGA